MRLHSLDLFFGCEKFFASFEKTLFKQHAIVLISLHSREWKFD